VRLLEGLLCLDPSRRLTCSQAKRASYFRALPLPAKPDEIPRPVFELSCHEYSVKQTKKDLCENQLKQAQEKRQERERQQALGQQQQHASTSRLNENGRMESDRWNAQQIPQQFQSPQMAQHKQQLQELIQQLGTQRTLELDRFIQQVNANIANERKPDKEQLDLIRQQLLQKLMAPPSPANNNNSNVDFRLERERLESLVKKFQQIPGGATLFVQLLFLVLAQAIGTSAGEKKNNHSRSESERRTDGREKDRARERKDERYEKPVVATKSDDTDSTGRIRTQGRDKGRPRPFDQSSEMHNHYRDEVESPNKKPRYVLDLRNEIDDSNNTNGQKDLLELMDVELRHHFGQTEPAMTGELGRNVGASSRLNTATNTPEIIDVDLL
jgi:hypothetical protein